MLLKVAVYTAAKALRDQIRTLLEPEPCVLFSMHGLRDDLLRPGIGPLGACDLAITDEDMLPLDRIGWLSLFRAQRDAPEVVLLVKDATRTDLQAYLRAGCLKVVSISEAETIVQVVREIHRRSKRAIPIEGRDGPVPRLSDFYSQSQRMQRLLIEVERVVDVDTSLLISGETGVGKEWLARAIHETSPRRRGPFVAINCAAIPDTLLESELFGHEEGAFTGAHRARRGHFELAHRGTILLDEIGEMPLHLQSRLLRVLQDRWIQPVGSEEKRAVDVRVMAASNRSLPDEVDAGRFRADLYYRLGVVSLHIPPLRERPEDILALAQRYLASFGQNLLDEGQIALSPEAALALSYHAWPGNVRELANVIERAVLFSNRKTIDLEHLPEEVVRSLPAAHQDLARASSMTNSSSIRSIDRSIDRSIAQSVDDIASKTWREFRSEALGDLERSYLEAVLSRAKGRIGEAARIAGMSERALFEKMRLFGLRKEQYRT